jgi:hypothetical protein
MNIKFSAKMKTTATIVLILLMASFAIMTFVPTTVKAQPSSQQSSVSIPTGVTPAVTVPTTAYLSFEPDPIGVDQTLLVNFWVTVPPASERMNLNYAVTITKPDGTTVTETMNSYPGDGSHWFNYVPDQVGTYKLQFTFPGTYDPAGWWYGGICYPTYAAIPASVLGTIGDGSAFPAYYDSVYFEPSSTAVQTLTVQKAPIAGWPAVALPGPGDYWTRPVSPNNREWWPILGYYPATGVVGGGTDWPADTNAYGSASYSFTPYVTGPTSAHIVWDQESLIGGLIGGPKGETSLNIGFIGMSATNIPSLCYAGRCYQVVTAPGGAQMWESYNIQTGQVYWEIPIAAYVFSPFPGFSMTETYAPTFVTYDTNVPETTGASGYAATEYLGYLGNGQLLKYDPSTGTIDLNCSIAPLFTGTVYSDPYVLSIQAAGTPASPIYYLINWTMAGLSPTLAGRIISNTTYAMGSLPPFIDWSAGYGASVTNIVQSGAWTGMTVSGYNLETGVNTWSVNVSETAYNTGSCCVADHGLIAIVTQSGTVMAWNLVTGQLAWTSPQMEYPWASEGFGGYSIQSAYGLIYYETYAGIYAFNWSNGKIAWMFQVPAPPFETSYFENGTNVYSFADQQAIVADGMLYAYEVDHTPIEPLTRGWSMFCIDATTGVGIWNITDSQTPGAIEDGYLVTGDTADGYMYVYGIGQSATTVSAPQTGITSGQSVLISGTVLDQSPAQPGTPCVSDVSMTTYMEYLHFQMPINGLYGNATITGVPVSLDAVAPDGTSVHIATVTTDGTSGTFAYTWTPTIAGQYKITATYAGDDSYSSSSATTYATVVAAPTVSPTPTPISISGLATTSSVMTYIIIAVIAIIIAIAIVGALLLRKHA